VDDPGLVINDDGIQHVNMGLSGSFSLFGLGLEIPNTNPLTLQYDSSDGVYMISGTVIAPALWNATATMGTADQPCLVLHHGSFSVDAFSLGMSDVRLGAFTIKKFLVSYTQTADATTYAAQLAVEFPQKWEVAGGIIFVNNEVHEVTLQWQADSASARIPIGTT